MSAADIELTNVVKVYHKDRIEIPVLDGLNRGERNGARLEGQARVCQRQRDLPDMRAERARGIGAHGHAPVIPGSLVETTQEAVMAHVIEEESGSFDRPVHQHNGYYAGACFIGFAIGESLGAAALRPAAGPGAGDLEDSRPPPRLPSRAPSARVGFPDPFENRTVTGTSSPCRWGAIHSCEASGVASKTPRQHRPFACTARDPAKTPWIEPIRSTMRSACSSLTRGA